jgi:peroxiredoxin
MSTHHSSLLICLLLTCSVFLHAQPSSGQPEVGKPLPDFHLPRVTQYKKSQASRDDFKGKWLFLDFWFTGCTTCIHSLPKVNRIHQQFKNDIHWVMVGMNNYDFDKDNKAIERLYEKLRVSQGLQMISAYDSVLHKRWSVATMPHIIIIDPEGIVRYITDGRDITAEKIHALITGKPVSFFPKTNQPAPAWNPEPEPGNQRQPVFRSILTAWNGEKQDGGYPLDEYVRYPKIWPNGYNLAMVNLYWLYNTAYLGKYYFKYPQDPLYGEVFPLPVLELRDTTRFHYDYTDGKGKGLYNYNLLLPAEQVTKENLMLAMQQDLQRAFPYQGTVEYRNMPVWMLVLKSGNHNRLTTKGGTPDNSATREVPAAGFAVRNVPVKTFLNTLTRYLAEKETIPFIDGTGITTNIDITIQADLTNLASVKKELNKNGLDLIKATKRMQTLVIRDQ